MKIDFHKVPITHEHKIISNSIENPKRIYILLHGYQLDGEYIFKRLREVISKDALIIAPNGPFLSPYQKNGIYEPRFAWYFFNPAVKEFYINYLPGAEYVKEIVNKYNPQKIPVSLIGYSQGGYLAPKVAEIIPEVDTVVGLACVFRNKLFKMRDDVVYHQIHGENDSIVDCSGALFQWEHLKSFGNTGSFKKLKGAEHRLGVEFVNALKQLSMSFSK